MHIKPNGCVGQLLKTIGEILTDEPYDPALRRKAIDDLRVWLAQADQMQVKETLLKFIDDPDSTIQCTAIDEALKWSATSPDQDIMNRSLAKLNSEHEYIRGTIVYGLYSYDITDDQTIDALVNVLLHDSSSDVRSHAATLLGRTKHTKVKPALEWARDNDFEKNYENMSVSQSAEAALRSLRRAE